MSLGSMSASVEQRGHLQGVAAPLTTQRKLIATDISRHYKVGCGLSELVRNLSHVPPEPASR